MLWTGAVDEALLQYLIQQTGAAGIAGLTVFFFNRLQAEMTRRNDEYARKVEGFNERLFSILTETIRSIATFQGRLSAVEDELRELRRAMGGQRE